MVVQHTKEFPITTKLSLVLSRLLLCGGIFLASAEAIADEKTTPELGPAEIQNAITADLGDRASLTSEQITVDVEDGLVTLSGRVKSLMDKRRAASVAKQTRGVQAVLNQLIVRPTDKPDEKIRRDVQAELADSAGIDQLEIEVDVTAGEVAMLGKVESLAEKRLAETAAASVHGVTGVENQLTVEMSHDRSERELRNEIQGLLENSIYLDDAVIDVRVDDQTAYLTGKVGTAAEKAQAKALAEIWGITDVDAEGITVDPESADGTQRAKRFAKVSDNSIAEALRRSFYNDPIVFTAATTISTEVNSGVVTLTGTVNRLRIKTKAERLAMDVVGVHRVVNELEVKYEGETPPDAVIIRLTQEALQRSPYLDRQDVRVHCQRAHVSLYGITESEFVKNVAGWIANSVPGVVHVNNMLAVESEGTQKTDAEIEKDLERKLKFHLLEKSNDVRVEVSDGVAVLSGEVDTWRQWQLALDLAIEAGARTPHNMIDVRYHPPHGASDVYVPE